MILANFGLSQEISFTYYSSGNISTKKVSGILPEISTFSINHKSCFGQPNGSISLQSISGQAPIEVLWNNGSQERELNNLSEGLYSVSIRDARGCAFDTTFVIGVDPGFTFDIELTPPCPGSSDGELSFINYSGTDTPSLTWGDGSTSSTLMGVGEGSYTLSVLDEKGCSKDTTLYVDVPEVISVKEDVSINADSTLNVKLDITGGYPPYEVKWDNGVSGEVLESVPIGTYNYVVTDSNNCTYSDLVTKTSEIDRYTSLSIYPNPSHGKINVEYNSVSSVGTIQIFNMQGILVAQESITPSTTFSKEMNLELSSGLYLLVLSSTNGSVSEKFVIHD